MGMIHQCKCDGCGATVDANKTVGGDHVLPPDWYAVHWQQKNSNQTGGNFQLLKLFTYCPKCGQELFSEACKTA